MVKIVAFYDALNGWVDGGRSVYVLHLNFCKAFAQEIQDRLMDGGVY